MNPQARQLFRTIDQCVNQLRQIVGNSQITTEYQQGVGSGGGRSRGRGRGKKGRARNFSNKNYQTFGQLRRQISQQGGVSGRNDPGFTDGELFEMLDRAKVNPVNNAIDVTTREGNILLSYGWVDPQGRLHPEIEKEFSTVMGGGGSESGGAEGGGSGGGSGGSGGSFNRPLHRGGNRVLTGSHNFGDR
jgi:hypothetical protein